MKNFDVGLREDQVYLTVNGMENVCMPAKDARELARQLVALATLAEGGSLEAAQIEAALETPYALHVVVRKHWLNRDKFRGWLEHTQAVYLPYGVKLTWHERRATLVTYFDIGVKGQMEDVNRFVQETKKELW